MKRVCTLLDKVFQDFFRDDHLQPGGTLSAEPKLGLVTDDITGDIAGPFNPYPRINTNSTDSEHFSLSPVLLAFRAAGRVQRGRVPEQLQTRQKVIDGRQPVTTALFSGELSHRPASRRSPEMRRLTLH